jgi:hypothetical protein
MISDIVRMRPVTFDPIAWFKTRGDVTDGLLENDRIHLYWGVLHFGRPCLWGCVYLSYRRFGAAKNIQSAKRMM